MHRSFRASDFASRPLMHIFMTLFLGLPTCGQLSAHTGRLQSEYDTDIWYRIAYSKKLSNQNNPAGRTSVKVTLASPLQKEWQGVFQIDGDPLVDQIQKDPMGRVIIQGTRLIADQDSFQRIERAFLVIFDSGGKVVLFRDNLPDNAPYKVQLQQQEDIPSLDVTSPLWMLAGTDDPDEEPDPFLEEEPDPDPSEPVPGGGP